MCCQRVSVHDHANSLASSHLIRPGTQVVLCHKYTPPCHRGWDIGGGIVPFSSTIPSGNVLLSQRCPSSDLSPPPSIPSSANIHCSVSTGHFFRPSRLGQMVMNPAGDAAETRQMIVRDIASTVRSPNRSWSKTNHLELPPMLVVMACCWASRPGIKTAVRFRWPSAWPNHWQNRGGLTLRASRRATSNGGRGKASTQAPLPRACSSTWPPGCLGEMRQRP